MCENVTSIQCCWRLDCWSIKIKHLRKSIQSQGSQETKYDFTEAESSQVSKRLHEGSISSNMRAFTCAPLDCVYVCWYYHQDKNRFSITRKKELFIKCYLST